jgi:hypothetical protein
LLRAGDADRGALHQQCSGTPGARRLLQYGQYGIGVKKRGEDDVGVPNRSSRRGGHGGTGVQQGLGGGFSAVPARHFETLLEEPAAHRRAHGAGTEDADPRKGLCRWLPL